MDFQMGFSALGLSSRIIHMERRPCLMMPCGRMLFKFALKRMSSCSAEPTLSAVSSYCHHVPVHDGHSLELMTKLATLPSAFSITIMIMHNAYAVTSKSENV